MSIAAARAWIEPHREATFDPFENDMGESSTQRFISEDMRPQIEVELDEQSRAMFVGADQYIAWDPDDPEKVLAPDVYTLPGVRPGISFDYWKVWQTGIVPAFALEVVSKRKKKDYTTVPPLYDELGVRELVIFDPRYKRRHGGLRFQVYRRIKGRGLVRVDATNEDRVRSRELGRWIRVIEVAGEPRLRLARGPHGDELLPVDREKVVQLRARAEKAEAEAAAEKLRAQSAEAEAAAEKLRAQSAEARAQSAEARAQSAEARAQSADAEVEQLRAALARLGGRG